jgi:outer membrane immunogenic protein
MRVAPPPVVPAWSWSGCYFGGYIGGLWARKEWFNHDAINNPDTLGQSEGPHDADGLLGGILGGCDYQFAGGFVIGISGDLAGTNAAGSGDSRLFPGITNHSSVESLALVTARIGYAWGRFLGYVKGGAAWERDEYHYTDGSITGSASETRSGWTIGIGGEYAFTDYVTGFIEYNYYGFGTRDLTFVETAGDTYLAGIEETKSVVKVGLGYRFGGLAALPVR